MLKYLNVNLYLGVNTTLSSCYHVICFLETIETKNNMSVVIVGNTCSIQSKDSDQIVDSPYYEGSTINIFGEGETKIDAIYNAIEQYIQI